MIRLSALCALLCSTAAFADDPPEDQENARVTLEENSRLETKASFESEWHEFNNIDFRPLDETSDQAILDSDDRSSLAFTGAALQIGYDVDSDVRLVMAASHRGLWGNDQFGSVNSFGGFLYFNAMYVDLSTRNPDHPVVFRLGRQDFRLGVIPDQLAFTYRDIVDQLRVDIPLGDIATLILVPVNISAMGAEDDPDFVRYVGQSQFDTFTFRGDTLTRRHGVQILAEELGPVQASAYTFYTDVGAQGSGSDISYHGLLGNFSDNDWVLNWGLRARAEFGAFRPFASLDGSNGIDRKELIAQDVDTNGMALLVGAEIITGEEDDAEAGIEGHGLRMLASFYNPTGPAYGKDGLQYSHGYVGMKGRHAGGALAGRLLGWHPSPYVGIFGVDDSPQDQSRKAGTRVIQAEVAYDFGKVTPKISWWMMQDTGLTFLDFGKLDTITPPFGYAREGFAAQERAGQVLGNEIDLSLEAKANDHVEVYASGSVLLPGGFYGIRVARLAGSGDDTALGSDNPAMPWGAYAGARVHF